MDEIFSVTCQVLGVDENSVEYDCNFVSPAEIRRLNAKFRDVDKETDVLSFPNGDINPETGKKFLGDILICKEVASQQAKLYNQSLEREITFLTIHGLLHLFGFDHIEKDDEQKMREKQREILSIINGDKL